jgi:hypothetical protein
MKPEEVEQALGIEHYTLADKNQTVWQYGKCGAEAKGTVVFRDGQVLYWTQPDF